MDDGKIAPDGDGSGDGGDVGEQRSPDTIQREIEATRAELADTIDAIADRISPRRAASRGAQAVKSQVTSVLGSSGGSNGTSAAVLDAPARAAGATDPAARRRAVENVVTAGGGSAYTGTSAFAVERRLRTDRVLLALGGLPAVAGAIVIWRARD